jgi:hypothetical protein
MASAQSAERLPNSEPRGAAPTNTTAHVLQNDEVRATALEKVVAFETWFAAHRGQITTAASVEGAALARERRAGLKQLIMLDPRVALAHAVTAADRRILPAAITSELEHSVDAFGNFEVIAVCENGGGHLDRWTTIGSARFATYTYGRRLATLSKDHLAVHGISIDDQLALSEQPYRALTADEIPSPVPLSNSVAVAVGDQVQTFASPTALDAWSENVAQAEALADPQALTATPAPLAATSSWTTGEKTVLWIRAEFPDDPGSPATDEQITTSMAAVSTFYQAISQGTCSFKTTILPGTVRLTTTKATYAVGSYLTLRADALQLARNYDAANGGTGLYNPDQYDRYVVIFKDVPTYTWAGIASIGTKGLSLNGTSTGSVAAHELGHNHGLHHSHAWTPSTASPIGAGSHMEYGDAFDDMGSGQAANTAGHFNAVQKFNLGYLAANAITTVTQSGRYRIYRHDDPQASGVRALRIPTSAAGTNYWFEYRRASPDSDFTLPTSGQSQLPRLQNGVVVHWDKGPSFTIGQGTYLLDMTPTTNSGVPVPTDLDGLNHLLADSALALGESFTDSASGMTITPVAVGGSAPREWIEVYVSFGAASGNRPPSINATGPAGHLTARVDTTFNATAVDPDGDNVYYRWDFGDGSIPPATASVTHQWLKGGTYTVRCTALDGKGGETSTSFDVTVDDPLLSWVRRGEGVTTSALNGVVFGGGKFVAVGGYVSVSSPDGVTWTRGSGMTNNYSYAVAYGNSRYVAVGYVYRSSTQSFFSGIAASADGAVWTDYSPGNSIPDLRGVAFGAGRFVAVGKSGIMFTSTDGTTWTAVSSGTGNDLYVVRYDHGQFVAAGALGTFLISTDGVTWQNVSLASESSSVYGLIYNQNAWLAITSSFLTSSSNQSKQLAWSSSDGQTWTKIRLGISSSVNGPIAVANSSLLLGVSRVSDGQLFIAQSIETWAVAPVFPTPVGSVTSSLQSAAEGNGTIVIVGTSGQIYTPGGLPVLVRQPASQWVYGGQSATFTTQAYATGPFTYQWSHDGTAISGATNATLTLASTSAADAGGYTVAVKNSTGLVTASTAQLVINVTNTASPGRVANLSIRSQAGKDAETLIVGVTVGGAGTSGPKPLLIRGIGPALIPFGVSNALADPVLTVFQNATVLTSNDNWGGDASVTNAAASVGAFALASSSKDAAIAASLNPAGYTIQINGNNGTGVALAEIYDATSSSSFTATTPRLTNVSARTRVGTGGDILITGFVLGGGGSKTLLIRAVGPTLEGFGVTGALSDPKLELNSGGTLLAANDDWAGATNIATAAQSVGAFPLDASSKDAVLLVTLPPGAYTAQVTGVGSTTGVALVEVYEVP